MSAPASRPPKNPFPYQGAFALETRSFTPHGQPLMPPTLVVPPLNQLRRLTTVYAERFGVSDAPRGQILMLRGEHGAGKTHALGYLMARVATDRKHRSARLRDILQLYVKAEGPDLVNTYRRLMVQLPAPQLRGIAQRFFSEVTADTLAQAWEGELAVNAPLNRVRDEPALAHALLDRYTVDATDVLERRDEELGEVTGRSRDFRRAFSYLDDDELGDAAYRWLIGQAPDTAKLRRLGLDGPIDDPEMAKRGLQLLAAMCGRGGVALIVYLDQYEKLVLDEDQRPIVANVGVLHSLVEAIPQQDAMLVVSGNNEAWQSLPPDLRARFGYNVVEARGLDLVEARALIELYLHPRDEAEVETALDDERLAPFATDAIRLAHAQSRGNARVLLQLCNIAMDEAEGDRGVVGADMIERAIRRAGGEALDPDAVVGLVERLARADGFIVERDPEEREMRLARGGATRLLILLGESTFHYDEVLDARRQLELIEALRKENPGAAALVIVLGYDSPEVRESLERAGVDVLPYRPETFEESFRERLAEVGADAPTANGATEEIARELEAVQRRLDEVLAEREADIQGLSERSSELAEDMEAREVAGRWQGATTEWGAERRQIEEAIREARAGRRSEEVAELERLRAYAEGERRRAAAAAALGIVVFVAAAIWTGNAYIDSKYYEVAPALTSVLVLAVIGASAWAIITVRRFGMWGLRRLLLRPRLLRDLSAPITSIEDLRRLTYRIRGRPPPLRFLVEHNNPQVRFVAAVVATPNQLPWLGVLLPGERSSIVRRAFAQRLGRDPDQPWVALSDVLESQTGEAVYIWDGALDRERLETDTRLPHTLRALTWIKQKRNLAPATRALVSRDPEAFPDLDGLDSAFRAGLPFAKRDAILDLPIDLVRDVARTVSPFEERGLGTFDELSAIPDIDRAYVSLSQVLFLSELGLLVETPA